MYEWAISLSLNQFYHQSLISLALEESRSLTFGFSDKFLDAIISVIASADLTECIKKEHHIVVPFGYFFQRNPPYFTILEKLYDNSKLLGQSKIITEMADCFRESVLEKLEALMQQYILPEKLFMDLVQLKH